MCQGRESSQVVHVSLFYSLWFMTSFLRYCVGLDISKDALQVCLSVIDSTGRVTVKATTKVVNKPTGFSALMHWVARHRKLDLPLTYLMESTARAAPWRLPRSGRLVSSSARPGR